MRKKIRLTPKFLSRATVPIPVVSLLTILCVALGNLLNPDRGFPGFFRSFDMGPVLAASILQMLTICACLVMVTLDTNTFVDQNFQYETAEEKRELFINFVHDCQGLTRNTY